METLPTATGGGGGEGGGKQSFDRWLWWQGAVSWVPWVPLELRPHPQPDSISRVLLNKCFPLPHLTLAQQKSIEAGVSVAGRSSAGGRWEGSRGVRVDVEPLTQRAPPCLPDTPLGLAGSQAVGRTLHRSFATRCLAALGADRAGCGGLWPKPRPAGHLTHSRPQLSTSGSPSQRLHDHLGWTWFRDPFEGSSHPNCLPDRGRGDSPSFRQVGLLGQGLVREAMGR